MNDDVVEVNGFAECYPGLFSMRKACGWGCLWIKHAMSLWMKHFVCVVALRKAVEGKLRIKDVAVQKLLLLLYIVQQEVLLPQWARRWQMYSLTSRRWPPMNIVPLDIIHRWYNFPPCACVFKGGWWHFYLLSSKSKSLKAKLLNV